MIRYAGTRISRIRRGFSVDLEARDTRARETSYHCQIHGILSVHVRLGSLPRRFGIRSIVHNGAGRAGLCTTSLHACIFSYSSPLRTYSPRVSHKRTRKLSCPPGSDTGGIPALTSFFGPKSFCVDQFQFRDRQPIECNTTTLDRMLCELKLQRL